MDKINLKEYTKEQAKDIVKFFSEKQIKEVKGAGTFEVVATTEGQDRDGEVILVRGWDTTNYERNPVILFGHDYRSFPIGAATEIIKEEDRLVVRGVFANTEEGQKARQLYDDGILRTVSVGFIPKTREGNVITTAELLELSFVPVPSNPEALSLAKEFSKMLKTVVPFEETEMAPEDAVWDSALATENLKTYAGDPIDFAKYAQGFAWFDTENSEVPESYKLIHHDIVEEKLVVVWLGVMAAMAELLGENSPVPEEDKQAAYNHLAKHYEQFGKEVPEFKAYDEFELKQAFPLLFQESDEEKKEVVNLVIKRLKDDVISLVASATLQIEQAMGINDNVKSKGLNGQKAGRTLSAQTRTAIKNAADSAQKAAKDLNELLKLTDAESAAKESNEETLKLAQSMDKLAERMIKVIKKGV